MDLATFYQNRAAAYDQLVRNTELYFRILKTGLSIFVSAFSLQFVNSIASNFMIYVLEKIQRGKSRLYKSFGTEPSVHKSSAA